MLQQSIKTSRKHGACKRCDQTKPLTRFGECLDCTAKHKTQIGFSYEQIAADGLEQMSKELRESDQRKRAK